MSDTPVAPDWERAQDGKWYAPGTLATAGWWQASDGVWYPPQQPSAAPGPPEPAEKRRGTGKVVAICVGAVLALVMVVGLVGALITSKDEGQLEDATALAAQIEAAGAQCGDLRNVEDAVIPGPVQATSTAECQDTEVMLNVFSSTADQEAVVDAIIDNPCGPSDTPFFVMVATDNWIAQPLSGLRTDAAPIAEAMDAEVFAAC